eukprot:3677278-Amphidinium_carterae.3
MINCRVEPKQGKIGQSTLTSGELRSPQKIPSETHNNQSSVKILYMTTRSSPHENLRGGVAT